MVPREKHPVNPRRPRCCCSASSGSSRYNRSCSSAIFTLGAGAGSGAGAGAAGRRRRRRGTHVAVRGNPPTRTRFAHPCGIRSGDLDTATLWRVGWSGHLVGGQRLEVGRGRCGGGHGQVGRGQEGRGTVGSPKRGPQHPLFVGKQIFVSDELIGRRNRNRRESEGPWQERIGMWPEGRNCKND